MKNCTRCGPAAVTRADTRFHAHFHANPSTNCRRARERPPDGGGRGSTRVSAAGRRWRPVRDAGYRYAREVAATMTGDQPGAPQTRPGLVRSLLDRFGHLLRELSKFATVGGVAFLVDFALFNYLTLGRGVEPVTARVVSTVIAATVAFVGNRFWTWRHRVRSNPAREYALFFFFNAVGLGIAVACLAGSRYGLGSIWPGVFRTPLADNIASYVVGTALGTLFRFWSYRRFVFVEAGTPVVTEATSDPSSGS
ncbi:GtrA family protein [Micromonospora wenchangensis]|uniref:GtrA family protein n=1 Tax=Micromonospora wenchangensis TaxID=1185415 RepID=UPI003D7298F5